VRDPDGIFITTGDRWPRSVLGNASFRVRFRGGWQSATAVLISDPEESRRQHERIFNRHGWFRWLAGIPKVQGHTDDGAVTRAIAAGRKLIRIDLDEGST
jgi:hypothetical protein